jgi:hypothetical protein
MSSELLTFGDFLTVLLAAEVETSSFEFHSVLIQSESNSLFNGRDINVYQNVLVLRWNFFKQSCILRELEF